MRGLGSKDQAVPARSLLSEAEKDAIIKSLCGSLKMLKHIGPKRLKQQWRKAYDRFLAIRGEPREIALGFALGLYIGMTPLMGVQMIIAVFFATLFKVNRISAAVGVWISNPLTVPVLYSMTYYAGALVLGVEDSVRFSTGSGIDFFVSLIKNSPVIFLAMFAGGAILGIPVAVAGYFFSKAAIIKYRKDLKARLARQKDKLARKKEELKRKIRKEREE